MRKVRTDVRKVNLSIGNVLPRRFHAKQFMGHLQLYGLGVITLSSFFPRLFHYQEQFFLLLFVIAIAFAWVAKINTYIKTPLDMPLIAFISWVLVTIPFSIDPDYSFTEWRKFIACLLVFYWAMFVLRVRSHDDPTRKIVFMVVLGSLALSVFALQDFLWRGGSWRDRLIRAAAPQSDYNWLTTYMVLTIPLLIGWLGTRSSHGERILGFVSLATSVLAQVAAYTRAGWFAHVAQAFSLIFIVRRQQLILWIVIGTVLAGIALMTLSFIGFQQDTIDAWTFSARVKTWGLGWQQVLQHPVVGIGFGNDTFSMVYSAEIEADETKGPVEKVLPALHNTFAMVLVGAGVPGLIFFLWIIVRVIRELLAGVRIATLQDRPAVLRVAIAFAVIGFMARNLFDYMFAGSLATLFWILVAIGFNLPMRDRLDNHTSDHDAKRHGLAAV